jgi:hypothetical protein
MDILSSIVNLIAYIVQTAGSADMFAATHNIKLGVIVILLVLELVGSIVFMFLIRKGILMGMGLWFIGTFIIIALACAYIVACILYTGSMASGPPFWLWAKIAGLG